MGVKVGLGVAVGMDGIGVARLVGSGVGVGSKVEPSLKRAMIVYGWPG